METTKTLENSNFIKEIVKNATEDINDYGMSYYSVGFIYDNFGYDCKHNQLLIVKDTYKSLIDENDGLYLYEILDFRVGLVEGYLLSNHKMKPKGEFGGLGDLIYY